jgi:hypothetical protein
VINWTNNDLGAAVERIEIRTKRMETRLAQLMMHMGLDPAVRVYDVPRAMPPGPQVWHFGKNKI